MNLPKDIATLKWKHRQRLVRLAGLTAVAILIGANSAVAQTNQPIIYPSSGQSLSQQSADEGECRNWAKQQTGFDPAGGAQYAPQASAPSGGMVRGAARGAALGAVGGAIGGDAGKGAAIGAGVGATSGLLGRGRHQRQQAQVNQQAQADHAARMQQFNRAFGTCMQGRGYTVN
jgi:hypothetical protein